MNPGRPELSVDAPEPQRRPFQFSIRKLMLWTAVWALYLGVVSNFWLPAAGILTIYLLSLLAIRMIWGLDKGMSRAILITGVIVAVGTLVVTPYTRLTALEITVWILFLTYLGLLFGLYGFLFVHFVALAVDWVDDRMRTKTPQDEQA